MPETGTAERLYLVTSEAQDTALPEPHLVPFNDDYRPVRDVTLEKTAAPGRLERTLEGVAMKTAGIIGGTDPMTIFVALEKRVFGNHEPENPYTTARNGVRY